MTRTNYFYTTTLLLLTVPGLLLFGIYGLFLSVPLAYLGAVLYLQRKRPMRFQFAIDRAALTELLRKGFPIMALGFVLTLTGTVDRFMVSSLLGVEQTGYYGLAALVVGFLREVPGAAREVMEPRLMKSVERLTEDAVLERYILVPFRHTVYLLPLLIGPVFLLAEPLLELLLPDYRPAVPAVKVLSLGVMFLALTQPLIAVLVAGNWQLRAVGYGSSAILVNLGASVFLVRMGFGIEGIAIASTLSFATLYLVFLWFVDRRLEIFRRTRPGFWAWMVLPYLAMTTALILIDQQITADAWPGAAQRLLGVLVFGALLGSLWLWDRVAQRPVLRSTRPR
jgi:O-antigen/teichoic acid export membrane protein